MEETSTGYETLGTLASWTYDGAILVDGRLVVRDHVLLTPEEAITVDAIQMLLLAMFIEIVVIVEELPLR